MTNPLIARLNAVALLLQFDDRIGEANQRWLRDRLDHRDWMDTDALLLSEMLPPDLRWMLEHRGDESGQSDG